MDILRVRNARVNGLQRLFSMFNKFLVQTINLSLSRQVRTQANGSRHDTLYHCSLFAAPWAYQVCCVAPPIFSSLHAYP